MTPSDNWSPFSALGISNRDRAAHFTLAFMGVFAFAWAVARARVQSVVGDEAAAYLSFAIGSPHHQWYPAAANHLLNTMLVRASTSVFGLSSLSLRAGALIGSAIYIVSAYWLCRTLTREWIVRLPLFACLVFNPYVSDFFVAARGYGLALAFLLTAIAISAWAEVEGRPMLGCALASLCIGVSFTANFSFVFADASLLLMIFLWMNRSAQTSEKSGLWRLVAACALPALIVALLVPSSMLVSWPKGQLSWGTDSVRESITSMIKATLYQLNSYLVNPFLYGKVIAIKRFLIPAFWGAALFQMAMVGLGWRTWESAENPRRAALAMTTGGAAGLALLIHWVAFQAFGLPLPLDRTGVFLAPLCTLMVGSAASIELQSRIGAWSQRAAISMLFVMAAYFTLCLRLTYFHEWQYASEAKQAYFVAAYFNHTRCAQNVYATWYYDSALEFYRTLYPHERFSSFLNETKYPIDRQLYVLNAVFDNDFIRDQKLAMVYHGETTDIAVFLPPSMALPPERACDAALLP
jgi:hypothetical protein